jgi:hypothetical protein
MQGKRDTIVRCTGCERLYAAYFTDENDVVTPGGNECPNCDGTGFENLANTDS